MHKGKILITPRSLTREGDPSLEQLKMEGYELVFTRAGMMPNENELAGYVPQCVGWLAGVEPIKRSILERAPKLKVISRNGTGIDNIDLQAAQDLRIKVLRSAGANARGVAELTIGLMFNLSRHILYSSTALKNGEWKRQKGSELQNKTMGLVGCGAIGRQVADMCLGLGMKVLAYDKFPSPGSLNHPEFDFTDLKTLLENSHVISLHCPPSHGPVLDMDSLGLVQKGAIIINTARSALVEKDAILQYIEVGKISGFATDVYDYEPPTPHPLLRHPKVITTAHIGGFTSESTAKAAGEAVRNLIKALAEP